jgi:hypothetical protein
MAKKKTKKSASKALKVAQAPKGQSKCCKDKVLGATIGLLLAGAVVHFTGAALLLSASSSGGLSASSVSLLQMLLLENVILGALFSVSAICIYKGIKYAKALALIVVTAAIISALTKELDSTLSIASMVISVLAFVHLANLGRRNG